MEMVTNVILACTALHNFLQVCTCLSVSHPKRRYGRQDSIIDVANQPVFDEAEHDDGVEEVPVGDLPLHDAEGLGGDEGDEEAFIPEDASAQQWRGNLARNMWVDYARHKVSRSSFFS